MPIEIESPAEAIAAIISVAIAADTLGSMSERSAAFALVKDLPAFSGYDATSFTKFLGAVTGKIFESLPLTEAGAVTTDGVAKLLVAVRPVLDADHRAVALRIAEGICRSDGANATEGALLAQLRAGLRG